MRYALIVFLEFIFAKQYSKRKIEKKNLGKQKTS